MIDLLKTFDREDWIEFALGVSIFVTLVIAVAALVAMHQPVRP